MSKLLNDYLNWPKEQINGWYIGNDLCRCKDCQGVYVGGTGSNQCYPCAIKNTLKPCPVCGSKVIEHVQHPTITQYTVLAPSKPDNKFVDYEYCSVCGVHLNKSQHRDNITIKGDGHV